MGIPLERMPQKFVFYRSARVLFGVVAAGVLSLETFQAWKMRDAHVLQRPLGTASGTASRRPQGRPLRPLGGLWTVSVGGAVGTAVLRRQEPNTSLAGL